MRTFAMTAGLLLAMSLPCQAGQIFKWIDAQGVTHFDAQPPQGVASTVITLPKKPQGAPRTPSPDKPGAQQQVMGNQAKQQLARQEAERKRFCTQARASLAQLQNNPRLSENTEEGTRRLTEEQRQQRIVETQKAIDNHCR
ncbi:DUF4124 domain-containing protein [Pseudomonas chlororaphis]|uniref:DUF4124 domain-containing protein n=1 Tax=Pseudomonas chlororaphis TaxID=587753 RepID=UPI0003D2D8D2|nr:DUF4124 domain-containing protein [Pseudomonas chlororaphis]AZD31826.1 Periplasmic protein TonB [Pseudomonas chlororaphis]ETD36161.1 glycosyltransferase [Pseudomonas chlororaphis subsp. aurantiaca PB-St2]QFS57132.1 DUF4124 domain-containing protein [Pseudomonas chlororaphis subsp. aurantiaca]